MNHRLDRLLDKHLFVASGGDQNIGWEGAALIHIIILSSRLLKKCPTMSSRARSPFRSEGTQGKLREASASLCSQQETADASAAPARINQRGSCLWSS